MQIVIDLDENIYTRLFDNGEDYTIANDDLFAIAKAIRKGTPLPEHHGDLIDRNELLKQYGLENATKYGNKNADQQKHSYSTMMMYEIADMIKDAETIIPATKEGDEK